MSKNNRLEGGYIALVVLLLAIAGGAYFAFKDNKPSLLGTQNTITEGYSAIEQAKDAKALLEENSEKTLEEDKTQEKKIEDPKPTITNNNNKKIMHATLHTSKGDITLELNTTTPETVENFVKLAKEGFYDGTKFHRVIKGFMSQGGDPLSKDNTKEAQWGTGGPGYKFADEITASNKNNKYTISMANAGPNTNGSQFFINAADNNFLDTKHTVFGHVTAGIDVAEAINNVPTDPDDRPLTPVVIKSITVK